MSGQFKAGDSCIGQNFAVHTWRNGQECIVINTFQKGTYKWENWTPWSWPPSESDVINIQWADGEKACVRPHNLRLKDQKKPQRAIDRVVSWSDCAWRPQTAKAAGAA